jgi:trehalose 6-phosphate synthase/phosphatase
MDTLPAHVKSDIFYSIISSFAVISGMNPEDFNRLVVVSNRLPVTVELDEINGSRIVPGTGGLVTALSPVLRDRGGVWIGWLGFPGMPDASAVTLLKRERRISGYELHPVELSQEEIGGFYLGFSNEVLWFLFHDFISLCNFDPAYWPVYQRTNAKFAATIHARTGPHDFIWVHDYHLILIARELRAIGAHQRIGFFLHIPFPPLDGFMKLPWRRQLLEGLLAYDILGFQTLRDMRNFIHCVRSLLPGTRTTGSSALITLRTPEHELRVGTFPIGIDFSGFVQRSSSDSVRDLAQAIQNSMRRKFLILGVDRLDYTKGLVQRLQAFGRALEQYPELRGNVTLLQVVVPSRLDVLRYQILKDEVERVVGSVNGRFTQPEWTPIHYMFRTLSPEELPAYYRAANAALITPLKDGMNLVAKEFCACKTENDGVLILSEFAGAAAQFQHSALLVNPFDIEGIAQAIYRAVSMNPLERAERMKYLRRQVQKSDVFRWVDTFLTASIAKKIKDFPLVADFAPAF